MTVSYNYDVSRNSFTTAFKLLFRWRGSVWKSVWVELVIWLIGYYIVMFIYRSEWLLTPDGQRFFEKLQLHIRSRIEWIPLNFLLGFYVSMVVDRWRQIFNNLGFIENIAISISCLFRNKEENDRHSRRALIRWLCLSQILVFRDISLRVRKRFPNLETIVKSGFMEEHEKLHYEEMKSCDKFNKYWMPLNWCGAVCMKSRETGRLNGDNYLQGVLQELKNFRTSLALLCNFDWVPVPLAYPQLVICAVRSYFILCLIARQYIIGNEAVNKSTLDLIFPFMTVLQFIFYIGWMKIAESLLNPMGEDDDHFECNYLIDRNIAIGLAIVDDTFEKIPEIIPDQFLEMPHAMYTESSAPKDGDTYSAFTGSVAHIVLAREDEDVDMVTVIPAETADETPLVPSRKTSFANRFGTTVKNKFGRRSSKFTARVVPTAVLSSMGAGSSPQRQRAAAVRRASEVPRGTSWRMSSNFDDEDSLDGSFSDLTFANSKDWKKGGFDRSLASRRMSVPMSVIIDKKGDVESGQEGNGVGLTPKHSAARLSESRPPTICEEEEEHSQGSEESKGGTNTTTPTATPTLMRKDRPSVTISVEPMEKREAPYSPPMTPKSILKNSSQPSSRCHSRSEPPSRDPHLVPVREDREGELALSVAEAAMKVLEEKRRSEESSDEESEKSSIKHVSISDKVDKREPSPPPKKKEKKNPLTRRSSQ